MAVYKLTATVYYIPISKTTMNTTLTHVNRSTGRLGKADSPELCSSIIDKIPLDQLLAAEKLLDVGCGYGGFAKAYVNRVEPYIGREEALNRIWLVDSYIGCVNYCRQRLGFKNVIYSDFLIWQPNMEFDVIIGNPPFQRPKHAEGNKDNRPLWLDFLTKSGTLLKEGGVMSMLVPGQVMKSTRWSEPGKGLKALKWGNILCVNTGMESYFNVGTSITNVVVTTGEQGKTLVDGIEVDLTERPWLPVKTSKEAFGILDKLHNQSNPFTFKLGVERVDPVSSFGFWRLNQNYSFNPTLTSERDLTKKLMWIGHDAKDVEEAEALMALMRSKLFTAFRQLTFYEPNYAHLLLSGLSYPDVIPTTDAEVYSAYGLTQAEIDLVEAYCS